MAKESIKLGGAFPQEIKLAPKKLSSGQQAFKTTVTIVPGNGYDGGSSLTLVSWNNGQKSVSQQDISATAPTVLEINLNSPTSVPPFILYLAVSGTNTAALDVWHSCGLHCQLPGNFDTDIKTETVAQNPKISLAEICNAAGYSGVVSYLKKIFSTATEARSPLVIDLDGDGVKTLSMENGVYFDHDGDGFAEKSGWAGPEDGLLVRDLNNNGKIDNGGELFGNNTLLANGKKAANGFEALKALDTNQNGLFDSGDAAWDSVKVWKDANSDGITDAGELLTLEEAGVSSIDLDYAEGAAGSPEPEEKLEEHSLFVERTGCFS